MDVDIMKDFQESLPKITVVAQDIGRVIMNVLDNAFYAVASAKKTAGADFNPAVKIQTRLDGKSMVISITDNGPGIPEKVRAKVFDPFFTTKPTGEGSTGLGLSLAFDIVSKGHGGTLTLQSTEGQGARFEIRLPVG